jgi:flagellar biosynthesis/type III secretory pathway ATPase
MDESIRLHDAMAEFLQQDMFDSASLENSIREMLVAMDREEALA